MHGTIGLHGITWGRQRQADYFIRASHRQKHGKLAEASFSSQNHSDQNSEDGRRLGTCTPFSSPSDGGAALAACAVTFGCYKIEGHKEWDFVVRVLIALQLQQVASLLAHMQVIAERMSREPQLAALRMRKQRLKLATEKVRKFP